MQKHVHAVKKLIFLAIPLLMVSFLSGCAGGRPTGRGAYTFVMTSQPTGADAYVDKFYEGATPLKLDGFDPGTYLIEVRKIGYLRESFELTIEPNVDKEVIIDCVLEEDPGF